MAGLVLARSSAGMADSTIRGELSTLEQIRDWFGRPMWEMEPSDADAYFGRELRELRGCRAGPVHTAAQGRVQAGLGGDNPAQLGPLRRRAGCGRPRRRHPRGAHYRFQISSSSGGSRNRILLAVAERALARTDGRSRSTVIVSRVSPGPAATAASRRTCGGWAETGLGQPWSSWPSAREAGPSRSTGVRVDERAVDVEVDTVKACRHGGSLPCCSSGSAPPPASHPSTRSRKNRGSRQASTPRPTSEAIGWETAR